MATLLGRYELLRPIAKGGMATVYLARVVGEGGFERLVALKLMHPHIADEPEFVAMFLDEARLAARIRHANVVPTLAVERGADGLFLVLEYVEGPALSAVVRARARAKEPMPIGIALRITIDMLDGLHAAHELSDERGAPLHLVHRDVSPQNVLIGVDGVARITDFGVAHASARLASTRGASLKGKVAYLSPEQITSGRVDRRSDLFAAGIVFWEMLTLQRLFRGSSDGQTLAHILAGVTRAPHEIRPDVPPQVSAACMKALDVNPSLRFQTAMEMVEALESASVAAGVSVAKPREVGAFLHSLEIAEAPVDAKLPSGSGSADAAATPSNASASLALGATLTAHVGAKPRRWRWLVAGAGIVALAVVGVVALGTARRRPVAPSTTPATSERPPPAPAMEPPGATASVSVEPVSTFPTAPAASSVAAPGALRAPKALPPPKPEPPQGAKPKAKYRPEDL